MVDIEIITASYGSSGSFVSRARYKSIGNKTYTGIRSNFHSKPAPINGPVHKSNLNYSYSRSHFSWLPQAVAKILFFTCLRNVSYNFKLVDPVINEFIPHDVRSHLQIFYYSIITFGIRGLCLGFPETSYVNRLRRFGK